MCRSSVRPAQARLVHRGCARPEGTGSWQGLRPFKFGKVHGFILNDGVWKKPHDPAFIENVSVEETKAALAAAGIANEVVPIPFNIALLKFGNETVLFDAGRAVGLLPRPSVYELFHVSM